jgi:hypothetical protein
MAASYAGFRPSPAGIEGQEKPDPVFVVAVKFKLILMGKSIILTTYRP